MPRWWSPIPAAAAAAAPAVGAALLLVLQLIQRLPGAEVNVYLTSGEVVRGEIVSQDDDQVHLRRSLLLSSGVVSGIVVYARSTIEKMVTAPDPLIEYRQRQLQMRDTASGHAQLAQWCRTQALPEQAHSEALRAVSLDSTCVPALAELHALGYLYAEGSWQLEKPYLQRTGQVRYAGVIMTRQAAAAHQAQDDQQHAHSQGADRLSQLSRQSAALQAQDEVLIKRQQAIAKELKALDQHLLDDQAVLAHFQDLNDAYIRAQSQPSPQGGGSPGHRGSGGGWGGNTGTNTGGPDASDLVRLGDSVEAVRPQAKAATQDVQDIQSRKTVLTREGHDLQQRLDADAQQLRQLRLARDALSGAGGAAPGPAPAAAPAPVHPASGLPPALPAPDASH